MENEENLTLPTAAWREEVYIETQEFIIKGFVFMPKIGKRTRILSEILNSNKQFLAVKDCTVEAKLFPQRDIEHHSFIQVNLSSILIMRPLNE